MSAIVLTNVQEKQILDLWNVTPSSPPGIKELTQALFNTEFDGRSEQGRAIKKFLSKHNLRAKATSDPDRVVSELSAAQKAYISTNAKTMNSLEMAKVLFNNPNLTPLHGETRMIYAYWQSLQPVAVFNPLAGSDVPTSPYVPPNTIHTALERVNQYMNFMFDEEKLTAQQKKNLLMLIGYLHTHRLVAQMNNYMSMADRKLCEDAFIRATYDKPDLAQEELDQYIEYSNQVVNGFTIQRRSNQLQMSLENVTAAADDDNIKISMSLVEAIGKASTEYHQCLARQQKLLEDLKEKRSSRLSKQIKDNASILNLIQMWKDEDTRLELLAHAEKEQKSISDEVVKLSSMSDIKARILGLTKEEILNG